MARASAATVTLEQHLLEAWEAVYTKGQLTLWIFLALIDGPKAMAEVKDFIDRSTNGAMDANEQSLYRALRRHVDAQLIDAVEEPVAGGPPRKVHHLTPLGTRVTRAFLQRNIIEPFYDSRLADTIRAFVQE